MIGGIHISHQEEVRKTRFTLLPYTARGLDCFLKKWHLEIGEQAVRTAISGRRQTSLQLHQLSPWEQFLGLGAKWGPQTEAYPRWAEGSGQCGQGGWNLQNKVSARREQHSELQGVQQICQVLLLISTNSEACKRQFPE